MSTLSQFNCGRSMRRKTHKTYNVRQKSRRRTCHHRLPRTGLCVPDVQKVVRDLSIDLDDLALSAALRDRRRQRV